MPLLPALMLVVAQTADPWLARLEGRWEGTGTVLEQASTLTMEWTWTLDGAFMVLVFRNEMHGASGVRRFEARAYYKPLGQGRYAGVWMDNGAAIRPIEARADGAVLVAAWGAAETEMGETTYRFLDDGRLEVTDRVRPRDGTWRVFGQSVLMKR